jgi:zinc transport system ATP-binding protein
MNKPGGPHPLHPVERTIAIRFDSVSFSYRGVKVLDRASFHIHQGEFIALVGPNGSGKTTILKLLLGLERPQEGSIEIFGTNGSSARNGSKGTRELGYVPQQAPFDRAFPIRVREVVKMGRLRPYSRRFSAEDQAAVEEALARAEVADLADRPYAKLSGGQRRRVLVARALAAKPEILILDEPAANMDAESEERLFETLGKLKGRTTILIVTHDPEFVSSLTGRVLCMHRPPLGGAYHLSLTPAAESQTHAGEYGIVQHPTKAGDGLHARVLHEESLPADRCYDEEEPE